MTLKHNGFEVAKRASQKALDVAKRNLGQTQGTLAGLGVGVGAGHVIGGSIGVVGFFGGVGIPSIALTAFAGAFAGHRLGIAVD